MFRSLHRRGWRGAIGLVAAYALVLQAFLGYALTSQAAALGHSRSDGLFVICVSHDGAGAPDGTGVPVDPAAHCPLCTLSVATAATLPDPVLLPIRRPAAGHTLFMSTEAGVFVHRARAGLRA